tara:strand:+ start:842 stop:1303 length:462 start_codon:yes stop_codon:yes gene_type:complete
MANRLALTIIVSIILSIILISIVNVGVSLFLERPEYDDFCEVALPKVINENTPDEERETINNQREECNQEYDQALKPYNQKRYYIFAGIGFILLLIGLFAKENMIQFTGLATGGVFVTQGIVMNFQNKTIVFISLIAILLIFGTLALKIIKKK